MKPLKELVWEAQKRGVTFPEGSLAGQLLPKIWRNELTLREVDKADRQRLFGELSFGGGRDVNTHRSDVAEGKPRGGKGAGIQRNMRIRY